MMYEGLVEFNNRPRIDCGKNIIYIIMKSKNTINGIPYNIKDDNNVTCIIVFFKKMIQLIHVFVTIISTVKKIVSSNWSQST